MRQFASSALAALAMATFSSAAQAGSEDFTFTQQATGSVTSFLSLPEVDVTITDYLSSRVLSPGELQVAVTLVNPDASTPPQTLTQLVLNSSAFIGMTDLPTVTVSESQVAGPNFPTVTLSSTPSLGSDGVVATDTNTGKGDLVLNFLDDGSDGVMNTGPHYTTQRIFDLYFHGPANPTALSFVPVVSATGSPLNNAVLTFTNVNGTPGAMGAMVVFAAPEPPAAMLGLAALGFAGVVARRRRGA